MRLISRAELINPPIEILESHPLERLYLFVFDSVVVEKILDELNDVVAIQHVAFIVIGHFDENSGNIVEVDPVFREDLFERSVNFDSVVDHEHVGESVEGNVSHKFFDGLGLVQFLVS